MPSTGDTDYICTRKFKGHSNRGDFGLSVACGGVNSTSINQTSRDDKTGRAFAPERGRFALWLPAGLSLVNALEQEEGGSGCPLRYEGAVSRQRGKTVPVGLKRAVQNR